MDAIRLYQAFDAEIKTSVSTHLDTKSIKIKYTVKLLREKMRGEKASKVLYSGARYKSDDIMSIAANLMLMSCVFFGPFMMITGATYAGIVIAGIAAVGLMPAIGMVAGNMIGEFKKRSAQEDLEKFEADPAPQLRARYEQDKKFTVDTWMKLSDRERVIMANFNLTASNNPPSIYGEIPLPKRASILMFRVP